MARAKVIAPEELKALQDLFGDGVQERFEAGMRLIVLPDIELAHGCSPAQSMGIYVAGECQGYQSRLFLEAPVTLRSGVTPPTAMSVLLGRPMYAASIQGISAALPTHQAVLAHLRRYDSVQ